MAKKKRKVTPKKKETLQDKFEQGLSSYRANAKKREDADAAAEAKRRSELSAEELAALEDFENGSFKFITAEPGEDPDLARPAEVDLLNSKDSLFRKQDNSQRNNSRALDEVTKSVAGRRRKIQPKGK